MFWKFTVSIWPLLAQHFSVLHPVGEVDLSVLVHVGDAEDPLDDEVLALVAFLKNQRCEV